jgi:hypothetical protein
MKKVVTGLAVLLVLGVASSALAPQSVATAQQAADQKLQETQRAIAHAVTQTKQAAENLSEALDSGDAVQAMPKQLREFETQTEQIKKLVTSLERDIAAYEAARTETMTELDREITAIQGAYTKRQMERLRDRSAEDTAERLQGAKDTLSGLRQVVEQGGDLHHAARVIDLGHALELQGQDMDAQVQKAKLSIAEYGKRTSQLLARLSQGVAAATS